MKTKKRVAKMTDSAFVETAIRGDSPSPINPTVPEAHFPGFPPRTRQQEFAPAGTISLAGCFLGFKAAVV